MASDNFEESILALIGDESLSDDDHDSVEGEVEEEVFYSPSKVLSKTENLGSLCVEEDNKAAREICRLQEELDILLRRDLETRAQEASTRELLKNSYDARVEALTRQVERYASDNSALKAALVAEEAAMQKFQEQHDSLMDKFTRMSAAVSGRRDLENNFDDGIPANLMCPITYEVFQEPVVAADGHSYERVAIERWLFAHSTSPVTGAYMGRELVTNHHLRAQVCDVLQRLGRPPLPPLSTSAAVFSAGTAGPGAAAVGRVIVAPRRGQVSPDVLAELYADEASLEVVGGGGEVAGSNSNNANGGRGRGAGAGVGVRLRVAEPRARVAGGPNYAPALAMVAEQQQEPLREGFGQRLGLGVPGVAGVSGPARLPPQQQGVGGGVGGGGGAGARARRPLLGRGFPEEGRERLQARVRGSVDRIREAAGGHLPVVVEQAAGRVQRFLDAQPGSGGGGRPPAASAAAAPPVAREGWGARRQQQRPHTPDPSGACVIM